jgi:hypothetical protein
MEIVACLMQGVNQKIIELEKRRTATLNDDLAFRKAQLHRR